MVVRFVPGDFTQEASSMCFKYLKKKFRKEKLEDNDRHLCKSEYGGKCEERVQHKGSDI